MPVKGTKTRVLVDAWDFSGQSNSVSVNIASSTEDVTPFQADAAETMPGETTGTITQGGYFNDVGAGYLEQELAAIIENEDEVYVGVMFGTDDAGCATYISKLASLGEMEIDAPVSGMITVSGTWTKGEGMTRGKALAQNAVTGTGALTGVDFGAAGAAGGSAYLWVTGITGNATNATVTVQGSTTVGFASPVTLGTFTFSEEGGYTVSLGTGTVQRYLRLNVTSMGGSTGLTLRAAAVVNGVTVS